MGQKQSKWKKPVLADHLKVGKRLIPPMMIFPWEDAKWLGHIVPELLWLGLLNDHHGWQKGADLSLSLSRAAAQATGVNPKEFKKKFGKHPEQWFASTSSYGSLTDKQRYQVFDLLKATFQLSQITDALTPLVALYPKCPLNFLFEGSLPNECSVDLESFKKVLSAHFDKDDTPATRMLTNAVYIAFCTNKLKVIVSDDGNSLTDSALKNFPAIEKYPETEESRIVAASVRGTVYCLFEETQSIWGDYFWNRGLEIEPCDYEGEIKNDI